MSVLINCLFYFLVAFKNIRIEYTSGFQPGCRTRMSWSSVRRATGFHTPMNFRIIFPSRPQVLNLGPWTPKGSVSRVQGVREDHKGKVSYLFKPLLHAFRCPLVVHLDNLGVRGNFFDFQGSVGQIRLRTTDLDPCFSTGVT